MSTMLLIFSQIHSHKIIYAMIRFISYHMAFIPPLPYIFHNLRHLRHLWYIPSCLRRFASSFSALRCCLASSRSNWRLCFSTNSHTARTRNSRVRSVGLHRREKQKDNIVVATIRDTQKDNECSSYCKQHNWIINTLTARTRVWKVVSVGLTKVRCNAERSMN